METRVTGPQAGVSPRGRQNQAEGLWELWRQSPKQRSQTWKDTGSGGVQSPHRPAGGDPETGDQWPPSVRVEVCLWQEQQFRPVTSTETSVCQIQGK